jgi:ABC-type Fe3+ transport system permease subunit
MQSVLWAWILAGTPYLTAGIALGIRDLAPRNREAMRVCGAGPVQVFWNHEFRGTLSVQVSVALQQMWFYLTSFSLVMILSGGPPAETLEVAIYSAVRLGNVDYSQALALALVQGAFLFTLRFSVGRLNSRMEVRRLGGEAFGRAGERGVLTGNRVAILISAGLALFFANQVSGVGDFIGPLLTTVMLAGLVSCLTVIYSLSSYFSRLRALSGVGAWISPLLMSLSIWNLVGFSLPSFLNVALIQTLFFAPVFSRTVFPILDRVQHLELEAAAVLGAGRVSAFYQIEWPRLKGVLVRTLGLVFSLSATEVTTVMLFSRGDFDTLSSFSQNLFSRLRVEEAAFGVMVLLMLSAMALEGSEEWA